MRKNDKGKAPGIRRSVMIRMILFVAFVIGILWLFQIVLLDSFYRLYNTWQIRQTASLLRQNLDNENIDILAERIALENDMCILVLDSTGEQILSVEGKRQCLIHQFKDTKQSWWRERVIENNGPVMEIFEAQFFRADRYDVENFRGPVPGFDTNRKLMGLYAENCTLSDGTEVTLLLNVSITPVNATVNALRYQLLLITAIVLLGAVLLARVISNRVAKPIVETNDAARDLPRGKYSSPAHAGSYREIAELNQTLNRAAEELRQVEFLQRELVANVSHDLRTPLTMIGGYAEVMRDIPSENTPENMQIIIDETNRLATLVNELLDLSRIQSGTIQLSDHVFCLTDSIHSHIRRIAKLVEKDGYTIRFEPDCDILCRADEQLIGRVIYNLIGNALTYTGDDRMVYISQRIIGQNVRIEVRDTGKGIEADELPMIWNRYYRTRDTHRRAVVGSGLGLNIVQGILECHHANYGVDSKKGEGTTFWFELPLCTETPEQTIN